MDSPIATGPRKQVEETPAEPVVLDSTLQQGDLLYIPRGFVHQATTAAEASAHVTLALEARTWRDVLLEAVEQAALADSIFRQAMCPPVLGADVDTANRAGELFALLSRRATNGAAPPPQTRSAQLDQRQALRGQLVQLEFRFRDDSEVTGTTGEPNGSLEIAFSVLSVLYFPGLLPVSEIRLTQGS